MNVTSIVKIKRPLSDFTLIKHEIIECVEFKSSLCNQPLINFGSIIAEEHDRIKINNTITGIEMYIYRNALVTQTPSKLLRLVYESFRCTQVRYYLQESHVKLEPSDEVACFAADKDSLANRLLVRIFSSGEI